MTRAARAASALQSLPKATRQQIAAIWRRTPPTGRDAVINLILALDRQRRRSESDARTDHSRRTLIGARVPREKARMYRIAAERAGMSLYAWVCDALEAHAAKTLSDSPPWEG